ncbi:PmoA family protein [Streptomyces tagetis]|uniref:PmoA family protein n=1 Tax=Streptomyces tagetis TaxID=2820809 RepID=A0A940XML0_9ACTN|nr:PmoA family protein [Streptomyces sp. RG38]MBQ0830332.1 PmoA family protein [Streptomyces sp. RG38]
MNGAEAPVLSLAGRPVARYVTRPELPARLSPRPHLHPVTTLAGTAVTESAPADHLHHLGVGVAVPDVEGHNFWGGRTYVRDRGPTELDNHGAQRHLSFPHRDPAGFTEELRWVAAGRELLREHRTVRAVRLTPAAWALDLTFALTNVTGAPLGLGSPATNGRPGAAYGGFFWRARKEREAPDVFTAGATGEAAVHGSRADWLALAGPSWTLVFAGGDERTRRDPWFVRTAEYPGAGSSLAHDARLPLAPGATETRRIVTVVADGRLDAAGAAALAREAVGAQAGTPAPPRVPHPHPSTDHPPGDHPPRDRKKRADQ